MLGNVKTLFNALIFIFPAYVANASPVIVAKIVKNPHPIDLHKKFFDNRRILGDGKTFEGFIGGVLAGTGTSLVLQVMGYHSIEKGIVLSIGALVGDMIGSFIKRRKGYKRGQLAPLLDQLDFLLGSLTLYWIIFDDLNINLFIILIIITPIIHLITNYLAYSLKLKNVPW